MPRTARPAMPRMLLRRAGAPDLPLLIEQRHRMFADLGHPERELPAHDRQYRRWARSRLETGEIEGYLVEVGGRPAGSGVIWWRADQPRPAIARPLVGYVMSMYTAPEFRRRGVAARILRAMLRRARIRRVNRVTLHASEMGRPVYARLGFERTWEMRILTDRAYARARARWEARGPAPNGPPSSAPARSGTGRRRSRSRPRGRSARSRRS